MNKYQNGKIYKLVNTEGTLTYIGSTTQTLAKRKENHHSAYKRWKNGKCRFVSSFKIFDNDEDGCQIVLLEAVPCESKIELEKLERFYIETMDCVNKVRPTRTKKEYFEENKDKIQKQIKQYKIDNMDKIKQQNKQYKIDNKDKIQQYSIDNKDKVKLKALKVCICECGKPFTHINKIRHMKTQRHQNYINSAKTQQDELDKLEEEFNNN